MDNRDKLKQMLGGVVMPDQGINIDLWLCIERGEYNFQAVEACKGLIHWSKQGSGIIDRKSVFYQYYQKFRSHG